MALKILVIEDDLLLAENLMENLLDLGYSEVKIASRYKEVFSILENFEPDLYIVDIYLKGSAKNGIQIMEEMMDEAVGPIIYLTSFDDNEFREKAKQTNPAAYLIKPASKQQIDVAIDFAVSNFAKATNPSKSPTPDVESAINLYNGVGYFFVKTKDRYEKILENELLYLKAYGTYTVIYTTERSYTIATNIKRLVPQLNNKLVLRCHRSFAVNKNRIQAFDDSNIYVMGSSEVHTIPMSRRYRQLLSNHLVRIKTE